MCTWRGYNFSEAKLRIKSRLQDVFKHLEHQAEYCEEFQIMKATRGDEYVVMVQWDCLNDADSTWESVSRISKDTPTLLKTQIRQLEPSAVVKEGLKKRWAFLFDWIGSYGGV